MLISILNVKLEYKVYNAVCVIFLIKLRWPKNKSLYNTCTCSLFSGYSSETFVQSVIYDFGSPRLAASEVFVISKNVNFLI